MPHVNPSSRIGWVDCAKGLCIILVVMMHSTLGVEEALGQTGWMGMVVQWAEPFRIPAFFLVSGLFAARAISRPWMDVLDRKIVHFAYFYVIWLTIQIGVKAPGMAADIGWHGVFGTYVHALVDPFGTLWFIYILPIFFVATKLVAGVPVALVLVIAALLEVADIRIGVLLVDEFAARYVYFLAGYALAPLVFRMAAVARANAAPTVMGLAAWALAHGWLAGTDRAHWPFVSLALGFAGAFALICVAALISRVRWSGPLQYCGRNSIVIYLGFFLPMAVTRLALIRSGIVADVGTISALVTLAGVSGALVMYWLARPMGLGALYRRPRWLRLAASGKRGIAPAE